MWTRKFYLRGLFDNWLSDVKATILEFIGTTFFLLLAFGGIQAATAELNLSGSAPSVILHDLYIALSMGFSLLISVWIFYRASGGVFNPNITLALFLAGAIRPLRFVLYCIAQLVGGIAAAAIVCALTPGPLLSNPVLADGVTLAQGVFIEMFITAALVLSVLMLAVEKHAATPFAPVGIGLTSFVCHLWGVYYTCASMNVARAFGPAVITGFPYSTQWVYWVGDGLGSLLATALYMLFRQHKYWLLNPGQDMVCMIPAQYASQDSGKTAGYSAIIYPKNRCPSSHSKEDHRSTATVGSRAALETGMRGRRCVSDLV
ncbi:hypothetical protein EVJ58_g2399 [Rhodofomes roseus]|uniref:Aquaporin-like protein n=1 Tax=Rhodofomes roseus TaxID=34475 RepID=A0A4Y9YSU3_9APHY|nr:hypothetical protein EVJ58_g2399 [Rhodofomes roseus]